VVSGVGSRGGERGKRAGIGEEGEICILRGAKRERGGRKTRGKKKDHAKRNKGIRRIDQEEVSNWKMGKSRGRGWVSPWVLCARGEIQSQQRRKPINQGGYHKSAESSVKFINVTFEISTSKRRERPSKIGRRGLLEIQKEGWGSVGEKLEKKKKKKKKGGSFKEKGGHGGLKRGRR